MLGSWHECRFRLPDGCQAEAVLSFREAASLAKSFQPSTTSVQSANPKKIRLLMGAKEDAYAEPSDRFSDFNQALPCMLKDCGFQVPIGPQRGLFEEV